MTETCVDRVNVEPDGLNAEAHGLKVSGVLWVWLGMAAFFFEVLRNVLFLFRIRFCLVLFKTVKLLAIYTRAAVNVLQCEAKQCLWD